jgi:metallophosphoesterase superfamily enzyme
MTAGDALAFRDNAVWLERHGTLVVADLHVGRAAASNVEFPVGERAHLRDRLEGLLAAFDPEAVVFAGDVLERYDYVPERARKTLDELVALVAEAGADLVATPGNHDPQLPGVLDAPTPATHQVGDVVVAHGHEAVDRDGALYVVGHDHPAIEIAGRKRPAYLYGEDAYRGGDVLMLPAFTELAAGVTINRMTAREFASPLVRSVEDFRPAVRDPDADETLWFPALGDLRAHL